MTAKLPWNLLRTVGVVPWSNLYPFLCAAPRWQHALALGPLHSVGYCSVSPLAPLQAAMALATTFGLLPPLFVLVWRHRDRTKSMGLLARFCLVYGGISFVLAPLLGTWYTRTAGLRMAAADSRFADAVRGNFGNPGDWGGSGSGCCGRGLACWDFC